MHELRAVGYIYVCEYTKFPENIERRVPRPSPYLQNLKIMYGWGVTHQTNFKKVLPELSEEKPTRLNRAASRLRKVKIENYPVDLATPVTCDFRAVFVD